MVQWFCHFGDRAQPSGTILDPFLLLQRHAACASSRGNVCKSQNIALPLTGRLCSHPPLCSLFPNSPATHSSEELTGFPRPRKTLVCGPAALGTRSCNYQLMCLLPYETASPLKEGTATPLLSDLPTSGLAHRKVYQTLATFTSVGKPQAMGRIAPSLRIQHVKYTPLLHSIK